MTAPYKLLIVDDEEAVRLFCQAALRSKEFEIDMAINGQAALEALAEATYDLLLVDISMPVLDGLAVLEHVVDHYAQTSVIMMTGYATLEAAVKAQDLGAEGFLLKPFDDKKLLLIMNRVLERRRLRQDYARLQAQLPLISLSRHLLKKLPLESLAQGALEIICREAALPHAGLWLTLAPASIYHSAAEPRLLASQGQPPPFPNSSAGDAAYQGNLYLALDAQGQPSPELAQAQTIYLKLQTEGQEIGLLGLAGQQAPAPFSPGVLDFLSLASNYLAVGLENRHLYESIEFSQQKLETIFNSFQDGLLIHQAGDDTITQINETMAAWLNSPVEALLHRSVAKIPVNEQGQTFCDLAPPDPQAGVSTAEFSSPPWGAGKIFRVRTFSLYQKETVVQIVHVVEDVTQTNKIQLQLLQAEKLAALGRLSASLAHEINNPLQALRSGLRLLGRPVLKDEKRQRYVETMDKEVERLIDTTIQTLDFARPSRIGKQAANINYLLQETMGLVGKQLQRSNIEPKLELAPHLPTILAIPDQIKQVFLNLVLNAIDAMPEGGRLDVATCHDPDENYVIIEVQDTGQGIEPEALDKIYEPFFSTKESGTGLGLSISYSIVEAHGGRIEVKSRPGQGSQFRVYLPLKLENEDEVTHSQPDSGG